MQEQRCVGYKRRRAGIGIFLLVVTLKFGYSVKSAFCVILLFPSSSMLFFKEIWRGGDPDNHRGLQLLRSLSFSFICIRIYIWSPPFWEAHFSHFNIYEMGVHVTLMGALAAWEHFQFELSARCFLGSHWWCESDPRTDFVSNSQKNHSPSTHCAGWGMQVFLLFLSAQQAFSFI